MPVTAAELRDRNSSDVIARMDKHGISLDTLLNQLKAELKATETKFFAHQGMVLTKRVVPDWSTRQKARQDAHKLRGDYPAEQSDHHITGPMQIVLRDCVKEARDAERSS